MQFIMATKNRKKLAELERILLPLGISVVCESDLNIVLPEVEENGSTFEENALLKARSACKATSLVAVADDSGLCVDYLNGAPGIYSARFSGESSSDENNNRKLLKELSGVTKDKRTAKFVSAVACVFPDGREFTVRGECNGYIAESPSGSGGFGYDPLFISEIGCFGELSAEEKDKVSHRGASLKRFIQELKKYL